MRDAFLELCARQRDCAVTEFHNTQIGQEVGFVGGDAFDEKRDLYFVWVSRKYGDGGGEGEVACSNRVQTLAFGRSELVAVRLCR